jgi:hypothetical protein
MVSDTSFTDSSRTSVMFLEKGTIGTDQREDTTSTTNFLSSALRY